MLCINYATVQIVISSDLFIKQVIFGSNRLNIWASWLLGSPRCNTASYTKHPTPVCKITFSAFSRDMIMSMESLQSRLCIFHYQFSSIITLSLKHVLISVIAIYRNLNVACSIIFCSIILTFVNYMKYYF